MEEKEIQHNGSRVFYRVSGTGTPVMLVHGFAEAGWVWEAQWNELSGYRLLVPDLPGSGRSEVTNDMSMEGLAAALLAILDHENCAQCIMIGHSMGGYITLAFAEKYENRLAALGLFHSSAFADTDEKKATREKGIRFIEENSPAEFLKTLIPNLYGPETKVKNGNLITKHISLTNNFSGAALVSYYRSMIERPARTNVLKHTHVPVLMILGRHDTAVPLQDGLRQAPMPEILYIHILEKSGHMGMIEETHESNRMLLNFLESIETHHLPR